MEYKARADFRTQQYWSPVFNQTDQTVTIEEGTSELTVTGLGLPLPGVNVYASNAAESYLGLTGMTNAAGKVSFRLPAGNYNFRADYMSSQYFSGNTAVIAHVNNPIEISTGGGNLMLTVEKEPGAPLSGVNCFLFSSSGTYLGNQQVTSGEGQAEFNLADGNYLIRVDYLGYQFWTSDSTVPTVLSDVLSIVHSDVTVTVNAAYGSDISALDGIPVYLFTAAGAYMGVTAGTDIQAKVTFNLPEADYKVRADYLSGQFWSADFNATDVTVDIPHGLTTVHVFETGVDLSDVPVYLFTETGAYLGRQEHTDSYGIVTFFIPQGTYKFRVDHGGNQIWSDVINVIASEETTVEMDLDVLVSDLTTNPNPVRFDGAPPKYEREKIMLATLGSLTGLFPQLVEGQTTVDKLYFYINDHLGTQRIMTDDAGAVVWIADYKPFGEVVVEPGSIAANKFRFAGQYYDAETGLHYNYHRYYDPKTGRYLTPDPIGLDGGINLYAYVQNNPINLIDPLGLEFSDILPGIGKALTDGSKAAVYSVKQTHSAISELDECGPALAQAGLFVAKVSITAPLAYAGASRVLWYIKTGYEWTYGNNRIAPFGNRTGHRYGRWPHYHRPKPDPRRPGDSLPGQGKGRHRPWEPKETDKSFWERF